MKTIGIIAAMQKELEQIVALMDETSAPQSSQPAVTECSSAFSFREGMIEECRVVVMQCGIGKVNAALGASEMIARYKPDVILSSGCAGGADASLHVGDVIVGSTCAYHDVYCGPENLSGQIQGMPQCFSAPVELVEALTEIACSGSVKAGTIVSGDWFVDTTAKMHSILQEHPDAIAVDMESAAIAQTCYLLHVPFVSVRIVSDVPLSSEQSVQYADFWDRLADGSFEFMRLALRELRKYIAS